VTYSAFDFVKVTGEAANGLFKQAALDKIHASEYDEAAQIATSIKYQILCDHTAMVGVIKQVDAATG